MPATRTSAVTPASARGHAAPAAADVVAVHGLAQHEVASWGRSGATSFSALVVEVGLDGVPTAGQRVLVRPAPSRPKRSSNSASVR